jgi:hypothetical protein
VGCTSVDRRARRGPFLRDGAFLALLAAAICGYAALCGCAGGSSAKRAPGEIREAAIVLFRAIVVDVDLEHARFTVKEKETRETWTIAVVAMTQFRSARGEVLRFEDLVLGSSIQLRGRNRVPGIAVADEVLMEAAPVPLDTAPGVEESIRKEEP